MINLFEIDDIYYCDIPGLDGYKISECGKMMSFRQNKNGRPMKIGRIDNDGYLLVAIIKNGKATTARVHVLVALAYVPNPNPDVYTKVHHKDGNKQNCHKDNLEWVTSSQNAKYAKVGKSTKGIKHSKPVLFDFDEHKNENWAVLMNYGNERCKYMINEAGNIIGFRQRNGRHGDTTCFLRKTYERNEYMTISLKKGERDVRVSVHILVALNFIYNPNPELFNIVNHKDGNTYNNHKDNLEWSNNSLNRRHAYDVLGVVMPKGEKCGNAVLTNIIVETIIDLLAQSVSCSSVSKQLDVDVRTISKIRDNKIWKHIPRPPEGLKKYALLSDKEAIELHEKANSEKYKPNELAKEYNVSIHTVKRVRDGETYGSVTGQIIRTSTNNKSAKQLAQLSDNEALELRKKANSGKHKLQDLADEYNVSLNIASRIKNGVSYKWVTDKVIVNIPDLNNN